MILNGLTSLKKLMFSRAIGKVQKASMFFEGNSVYIN